MKKYHSYCCIIGNQLDLTLQKKEIQSSYQINTFFIKLAIDLLQETKAKTGLCPLCNSFLTNLKAFSSNQKKVFQVKKNILTHQDLITEMINRVERKEISTTELQILYLYSKALNELEEKLEQRTPI